MQLHALGALLDTLSPSEPLISSLDAEVFVKCDENGIGLVDFVLPDDGARSVEIPLISHSRNLSGPERRSSDIVVPPAPVVPLYQEGSNRAR